MSIPDYQTIMLPLLKVAGDGQERSFRDTVDLLAGKFKLTEKEKRELLPSGQQEIFSNRVGWARTYMKKAGLLESPRRGYLRITDHGRKILRKSPARVDVNFLMQFNEFRQFKELRGTRASNAKKIAEVTKGTPEEILEATHKQLQDNLAQELLQKIKEGSPSMFERLVVYLLVKMGYGGSRHDAGEVIGKTGDEGIDGLIKEDRLGLDVLYIQAKRWENTVSRPEVQKFVGALEGKRAHKGVMITTSSFSPDARSYVDNIDSKIILIDGERLAELMIEHDLGVNKKTSYEIKKIDEDYFIEE